MDLAKGRRIYIVKSGNFGNIIKSGGILGMKNSYAAIDDSGTRLVFMGKSTEFAYSDCGETPSGVKMDIPRDGVSMIVGDESVTRTMSTTLVNKYNGMSKEERQSFCESWENMTPEEKRGIFEDKRPKTRTNVRKSKK